MTSMLSLFGSLIVKGLAVLLGASTILSPVSPNLGAQVPQVVALFETSLASKITSSDTSMTLVSGVDKEGNSLSGFTGFVLDEGTASEEFVTGVASGTSVSSLTRGISVTGATSTVSALRKEHRRGASVKISNYPVLGVLSRQVRGLESISSSAPLFYANTPTFTTSTQIITKGYADALAIAGAPDGSLSAKGVFEAATSSELAAGTTSGDTSALLVPTSGSFNATSSARWMVPVTRITGYLSQTFLNLAEEFSFTGGLRSSSTTFSNATSGVLTTDSSGSVSRVAPSTSGNVLQSNGSSWTSAAVSIPQTFSSKTSITPTSSEMFGVINQVLPTPDSNSQYFITYGVDMSGGDNNTTTTIALNGTTLCTIHNGGSNSAPHVGTLSITMASSTSAEIVAITASAVNDSNCAVAGPFSINLGSSATITATTTQSTTSTTDVYFSYTFIQ